jgi:energy-converting hydrogenase A subunit M
MDKEFFPVEMVVGGKTYTIDYQKELKCSEETINDDLKDQPSFFAWYAVLSEIAQAEMAEAKSTLEMSEALLDEQIRKNAGGDKVTETMIKNKIRLDPTYQAAQDNFATARKNVGILGAIKESFYHRKDILISLASNMRAQSDPSIYIKKDLIAKP